MNSYGEKPDLDNIVDYKAEYSSVIKKHVIEGDQLVGLCPFHDDKNNSFSVNLKNGKWTCFAEGTSGNYVSFVAQLKGLDTKEAYKQILAKYRVDMPGKPKEEKTGKAGAPLASLTLKEYALSKKLPEDFLADTCHMTTDKDKNGILYVKMPYLLEGQDKCTHRRRYGHKEFRWGYGAAGRINLYGDWRYPEIRRAGYVILCEGESDTQTLWFLGLPALGAPGATNFKPVFAKKLDGLKVYVHVEPDKGGETFLGKVKAALKGAGFAGEAYTWSCQTFGVKDPSQLYMDRGRDEAARLIIGAIKAASMIDLDEKAAPDAPDGAPIQLRQPAGFQFSAEGIFTINKKTELPELCCRTPILIKKRLSNLDTGEEKTEICFLRDGAWKTAILQRPDVFTSKGIVSLMKLGCTVTSENAKDVVKFLGALEAENMDLIPRISSVSSLGWIGPGQFLPGHGGGVELDAEGSLKRWAGGYQMKGTLEAWKASMGAKRDNDKFRFILASAFAAPLLRIVGQRTFLVYNWGGSKTGKTAALKCAISAWGNWEKLQINFNATQVGLERIAGFFKDLPLCIDERQSAGKDQQALEKIVYMLGGGSGRLRGEKSGGLQDFSTWRTITLATGEVPIATSTTQAGVSARTIELYNGPFLNEEDGITMHQAASDNYGWAGPLYMSHLISTDEEAIKEHYHKMIDEVRLLGPGLSMSHITEIATVALADALADTWVFQDGGQDAAPLQIPERSWNRAVKMAAAIVAEQEEAGVEDVNESARDYLVDWILSNRQSFGGKGPGPCYGILEDDIAYIYPAIFNKALESGGFSPRKARKYLAENEIIGVTIEKAGIKYSVWKSVLGKQERFVRFDLRAAGGIGTGAEPAKKESEWEPVQDKDTPFGEQMSLPF